MYVYNKVVKLRNELLIILEMTILFPGYHVTYGSLKPVSLTVHYVGFQLVLFCDPFPASLRPPDPNLEGGVPAGCGNRVALPEGEFGRQLGVGRVAVDRRVLLVHVLRSEKLCENSALKTVFFNIKKNPTYFLSYEILFNKTGSRYLMIT